MWYYYFLESYCVITRLVNSQQLFQQPESCTEPLSLKLQVNRHSNEGPHWHTSTEIHPRDEQKNCTLGYT